MKACSRAVQHRRDKACKNRPDFGILVWDGGASVMRLSVREAGKDLQFFASGCTPSVPKYGSKTANLPGRPQDKIRLRMTCAQGFVSFAATVNGKVATLGAAELGFKPRYVGLFIRTHDKQENASVSFDEVGLRGTPDSQALKEQAEARRAAFVATEKSAISEAAAKAREPKSDPRGVKETPAGK